MAASFLLVLMFVIGCLAVVSTFVPPTFRFTIMRHIAGRILIGPLGIMNKGHMSFDVFLTGLDGITGVVPDSERPD
jgi:hypothetical protein